ncbi:MAG: hypothetical protein J2P16_00200 [Mycobacterium sp.]|nr:hypothetical protein [Mycobacterium sp.]
MSDLVRATSFEILAPAADLAERISQTEFVPRALRNRPEAVLACILAGHELGIGPMAALSKIHVIDGRPAPAAELMRAVALSAGHAIWVEETSTTKVTMCGRRAGDDHTFKVSWTLDDAKRAGLAGRQNWRNYPRAMLLARASAELCRLMCPEVLAGLSYAAEEVEDMAGGFDNNGFLPAAEPPVTEPQTVTRKAKKVSKRPALVAAPSGSDEPEPPPAPPLPDEEPQPETQPAKKELSKAQKVAIAARDIDIDHHDIVEIVTDGVTRSANQLNDKQLAEVSDTIRRIKTGEATVVRDEAGLRLIDTPDQTRPMTPEQIGRLRAVLDEHGIDRRPWVEQELGRQVDGWGDITSEEGDWLFARATKPTDEDEL